MQKEKIKKMPTSREIVKPMMGEPDKNPENMLAALMEPEDLAAIYSYAEEKGLMKAPNLQTVNDKPMMEGGLWKQSKIMAHLLDYFKQQNLLNSANTTKLSESGCSATTKKTRQMKSKTLFP